MLPKEGQIWKRTFHKGNFFHTVQNIPFCYVILVKIFKYRTHVIGPPVRSEIKCYSTLHKCPGPLLRYRPFNCPRTVVCAYNIIGPKVKCTWRPMCLPVWRRLREGKHATCIYLLCIEAVSRLVPISSHTNHCYRQLKCDRSQKPPKSSQTSGKSDLFDTLYYRPQIRIESFNFHYKFSVYLSLIL